jgi:transposase InsO family protein
LRFLDKRPQVGIHLPQIGILTPPLFIKSIDDDIARILSRRTLRVCADVIDSCDREIVVWSAIAHAGIRTEMVRDLMIKAVERRFASTKTSHPVEWFADNGSAYVAKAAATMPIALGHRLAFTPVRSPKSNAISEAFVKTLKRDYARKVILTDAQRTGLAAKLVRRLQRKSLALRPVLPLAKIVQGNGRQCLNQIVPCPVRRGAPWGYPTGFEPHSASNPFSLEVPAFAKSQLSHA